MASSQRAIATIDDFLKTVTVPSEKSAEANTEPGSIGGPTEHPVKNVEDGTRPAVEGEQSADNEKRVKEDQGPPAVDNAPEAKAASLSETVARLALHKRAEGGAIATPGSVADDQVQIGTNKQPTGDDPSVETASVKSKKDDPGSAHPARTDNDELNGGKYAFDANTPWEKTAAMVSDLGDRICAATHLLVSNPGQPPAPAHQKRAAAAPVLDPYTAQQAGWELAGLLNGTMDKQAADTMVVGVVGEIIKEASDSADRVIDYLNGFLPALKQANAGMPPMDPAAMAGGGAGGPPPGPGGGDEAALMAAMGGSDPAAGGGDPMGGGGGGEDPMAGGDPMGGGGGGDEAAMLEQVLKALNITPEQLEEALAAAGAGGDGGDGGGDVPPEAAGGAGGAPPPPMEVAAADRLAQEKQAAAMRARILEVITRSRRS